MSGKMLSDLLPWEPLGELGRMRVERVSGLGDADAGSVVFATDEATLREALESAAGAILASWKLKDRFEGDQLVGDRVFFARDPRFLFSVVAKGLREEVAETRVHASAVIGDGVAIGERCVVEAGVVLGDGVKVGDGCVIGARVVVYAGVTLGDRVVVQAGAVLGSTGFGYARDAETGSYVLFPQQGRLVIEDDVEIGANTTIDRGALGETRIGSGTKIDNLVHIGHNCVIGRNVIIAAQTGISGSSVVEDGAILGGQVGIGEHATVGAGVILGGGAGVLTGKKMSGSGQVFWGRPARPLKEYLRDLARLRKTGNRD
jgi:UDP-3-O-[3-hydroxymyristoyl] glucosamine N-acyltransferase